MQEFYLHLGRYPVRHLAIHQEQQQQFYLVKAHSEKQLFLFRNYQLYSQPHHSQLLLVYRVLQRFWCESSCRVGGQSCGYLGFVEVVQEE